jgi:hypothetical protein
MNVLELQRALRQLRCSGIAAGLEARLLEAQAEKLAPCQRSLNNPHRRSLNFPHPS